MKTFILTAFLLSYFSCLSGQEYSSNFLSGKEGNRFRIYKTWISVNDDSKILEGVLYEVKDSSILVSSSMMKKEYIKGKFDISEIIYNRIDIVKTRGKNSVGKGILIGAVTGFVVGGLIGFLSGDDNPDEVYFASTAQEKAKEDAIILTILGGSIGAIAGTIRVKIPIKGNMEDFTRHKKKLEKYAIR